MTRIIISPTTSGCTTCYATVAYGYRDMKLCWCKAPSSIVPGMKCSFGGFWSFENIWGRRPLYIFTNINLDKIISFLEKKCMTELLTAFLRHVAYIVIVSLKHKWNYFWNAISFSCKIREILKEILKNTQLCAKLTKLGLDKGFSPPRLQSPCASES